MLRTAVRMLLQDTGSGAASHQAWSAVLLAAGVDPANALALPQRLGFVFHIGRYDQQAVAVQLDTWAVALRLRVQPELADVVQRAADQVRADLREGQPVGE